MDRTALRRADLRAAVVLALVAAGMLAETSTIPMTHSYAGVNNVWYVSPALMPLLVSGSLLVLSLVLLGNAVRALGTAGIRTALRPRTGGEAALRPLLVIAALCVYVYVLIPRVDFFLASALFLIAFVTPFHLGGATAVRATLAWLAAASAAILLAVLGGMPPYGLDALAAAAFAALAIVYRRGPGAEAGARRRLRQALLVSLTVPLVVCPVFRYGLLVPLPTEGVVIEAMHAVRFAGRR